LIEAKTARLDRLTAGLAEKALKSISTRNYWLPYKAESQTDG
jgi:hypothetical protein